MMVPDALLRLKRNWQEVVQQVDEATRRSNRASDSVRIIGVSKYVDADTTWALHQVGCQDLGESRPQQLWEKSERFSQHDSVDNQATEHDPQRSSKTPRWHLIGHLQRNKIRRTLSVGPIIHSIDSERLLRGISDAAREQDLVPDVLLEVNISGDEAKTGLSPSQLESLVETLPVSSVRVVGLMAMAGRGTEADDARRQFEQVRELRDRLQPRCSEPLKELSMGMSADFREAIAAGATMVRIGSRLFDGVA